MAIAVMALVFVACGGGTSEQSGDGDDGGSPAAAEQSAPGVDADAKTITIGGWDVASGDLAVYHTVVNGTRAYFDWKNSTGGFNGWTVEFDPPDDGSDPARALQLVRQQYESEDVFLWCCGPVSAENSQVVPYLDQIGAPYISPNANGDLYYGRDLPTIFPTIPPYSSLHALSVRYATEELGASTFALVYQDDQVGQPVNARFDEIVESHGGSIAVALPFDVSDVDYTSIGQRLADADPDAVIIEGTPQSIAKTKTAGLQAGLDSASWFGPFYGAGPSTIDLAPEVMNDTYFPYYTDAFFEDTPAIQEFKDGLAEFGNGLEPDALSLTGWTAGTAAGAALTELTKDGNIPTREGLIEAAETIDGREVGVIPALTWQPGEHLGISQAHVLHFVDGQFTRVSESTPLDYFEHEG